MWPSPSTTTRLEGLTELDGTYSDKDTDLGEYFEMKIRKDTQQQQRHLPEESSQSKQKKKKPFRF